MYKIVKIDENGDASVDQCMLMETMQGIYRDLAWEGYKKQDSFFVGDLKREIFVIIMVKGDTI